MTLCTIPDAGAALAEVVRVLKPGARFHFAEHGHAPDAKVARAQDRFNGLQNHLAGGCNLNRDIDVLHRRCGPRDRGRAQLLPQGSQVVWLHVRRNGATAVKGDGLDRLRSWTRIFAVMIVVITALVPFLAGSGALDAGSRHRVARGDHRGDDRYRHHPSTRRVVGRALGESFSNRVAMRLALALLPTVAGLLVVLKGGVWWLYFVGLAFTVAELVRASTGPRTLAREQRALTHGAARSRSKPPYGSSSRRARIDRPYTQPPLRRADRVAEGARLLSE